jgi:serine/threonine protein kinase/ribosomal protein L40E
VICYKCGSHVPDGSKTCPNCGNSFEKELKKSEKKSGANLKVKEKIGFEIGDLVAGRYKIKSRIGEGPSGVVFRVLDTEMDVDIALKIMYKSVIGDEAENKRFQTEMRIARKIAHQNIIRVYDIDRDNGYSFYTMQLLKKLTLRKIINLRTDKKQIFSLQKIEPIFIQIYNALNAAQNFTYHGNLKPENVMILPDILKVCDFSLVKAIGIEKFVEINSANEIYIAPEIRYNWDTVDSSADIYSMAVIIYEMVTG